ncbi:hypothetical protein [Bradyrhizobium sp. SSUT77]|uniref:hypothetical protein n=1 Tax=Bradyrhizobium sp. SSUT77 TaxID=3040603 RepID=UPI002447F42C|nr:hypothetical protein [Bradyrhizobium sp. SSUT77]MDH2347621.1 hypothetical protein [Bradyrhizobium sp. SSUT77]
MNEFKRHVRSTSSVATLAVGLLLLAVAPGHAGHHGGNSSGQGRGEDARHTAANSVRNADQSNLAARLGGDRMGRKSNAEPKVDGRLDRGGRFGKEAAHKQDKFGSDRERVADGKPKMAAPGDRTSVPVGKPVEATGEKSSQAMPGKPLASNSASPAGVTAPVNTIHPILSPPAGNVTVSNGVTKYEIPNGAGGVSAYSSGPGKITVTNGKDSVTLNGGSVTVSNALGVGAAQNNVQVGARNGEGKTVVSVAPQKPSAVGDVTTGPGSITVAPIDIGKTAAKLTDGIVYLTYGPPIAAGYGLAKGGVKGAVHEVKKTAEGIYDFFAW